MKNFTFSGLFSVLLAASALIASSCGKDDGPGPDANLDIYAGGYYYNTAASKDIACYWKNGARVVLSLPPGQGSARCFSISVDAGVVYAVGEYVNSGGVTTACMWIDGVHSDMPVPVGTTVSTCRSVVVAGGEVYTAGDYILSGESKPCYWTGSSRTDMEGHVGVTGVKCNSIAVDGGVVYVSGRSPIQIHRWIDGVKTNLPVPYMGGGFYGEAYSVAARGGAVYIVGDYADDGADVFHPNVRAGYWSNADWSDTYHNLDFPTGNVSSSARAVTIGADGKVYIAGRYGEPDSSNERACYWVDGVFTPINSSSEAFATSIAVNGNKVYVGGRIGSAAYYWRNGTAVKLSTPSGSAYTECTSIVVLPKEPN